MLDPGKFALAVAADQCDGDACFIGPCRAPDTVYIIFRVVGYIEIDDYLDAFNVDAP